MAVPKDEKFVVSKTGRKSLRQTTKGWDLLCLWKNGSTTWYLQKDLKESKPVDIAEYVVGNRISEESAFAWWVPYTLNKRDQIIHKINERLFKNPHKFCVDVPTSIKEAYRLDQKNNSNLHAIKKEMTNVAVAFHILDHGKEDPVGYEHINCHLIYEVS